MSPEVDAGDIVHQRSLAIEPHDTAHTLYARLKKLELDVFKEAWPEIAQGKVRRTPQVISTGTVHNKSELFSTEIQRIDLDASVPAAQLLRKLRALTTSSLDEAAYVEIDGKRYRVQVTITEESGA